MFTVTITDQRVINGKPETYKETIVANSEEHLAEIRKNIKAQATTGGTQTVKVKKI